MPPYQLSVCTNQQDKDDALAVRFAVFVQEQNVPQELEVDEYDPDALHLIVRNSHRTAVGTLRILDKGNGLAKIGRVATLHAVRGQRVGAALMEEAVRLAQERGFTVAILDSQVPVIGFYERFGFIAEGPEFLDAGIPHRRMRRPL